MWYVSTTEGKLNKLIRWESGNGSAKWRYQLQVGILKKMGFENCMYLDIGKGAHAARTHVICT
jgi:hypothetical protein